MLPPDPSYFAQRLAECRAAFVGSGSFLLRWFGIGDRPGYDEADQINDRLRQEYRVLTRHGRVVWGSVAQVNVGMFADGPKDLPGVTVYSTDPHYEANPQDLYAVGRACFEFKNTEPTDPEFSDLARRLTDEFDQTVRAPLPTRLTDGRAVFLGATMFHRRRLPGGVLRASLFPMVVVPWLSEANMVLPLPYWSPRLCETWDTVQQRLEEAVTTSTARQVARAAEKRPVSTPPVWWDVQKSPVCVTPAMVTAFRVLVRQHNVTPPVYLAIGLRPDGTKFADLALRHDPLREDLFDSNGVGVIIQTDQVDQLRGALVDYQDTVFGTGIVIRLRGE